MFHLDPKVGALQKNSKSEGVFAKHPLSSSLEWQAAAWLCPVHRSGEEMDTTADRPSGREDKKAPATAVSLPL
jgi:hypothetical protein